MSPSTNRRLLLIACVLLAAATLPGCATPDVVCDMRSDYQQPAPPAFAGSAKVTWSFGETPRGTYGSALCIETRHGRDCDIRLAGDPPRMNDICALARLGHEVAHVMKGDHE